MLPSELQSQMSTQSSLVPGTWLKSSVSMSYCSPSRIPGSEGAEMLQSAPASSPIHFLGEYIYCLSLCMITGGCNWTLEDPWRVSPSLVCACKAPTSGLVISQETTPRAWHSQRCLLPKTLVSEDPDSQLHLCNL